MDRLTSEWVVDQDQALNAASTPGFKRMMETATSGMYDGCCEKTVKSHITCMAKEGKDECTEFHRAVLASGTKPAASGDLWSKNGTALFGLVSHGIERRVEQQSDATQKVTWEMKEKLAGAVPCNSDRHTGLHVSDLSHEAWRRNLNQDPCAGDLCTCLRQRLEHGQRLGTRVSSEVRRTD